MRRCSASVRFWSIFFGLTAMVVPSLAVAAEITLEVPRHAYYRGEKIPLTITTSQAVQEGKVQVLLDACPVLSAGFSGTSAKVLAPTADVKVGRYSLKATLRSAAGELSATEVVTVAHRPSPDRLEVWLWGGGDNFYFDHGFTITGEPTWSYRSERARGGVAASLDARLVRGVYATIYPCGGIARRDLRAVNAQAEGVAYRGAGRQESSFYNPFSPEVEKVRRENNRKFLEAIGDHPAVKVAFYNTELVDHLWLDNLNQEGGERTRKALGFTRDQRGQPKWVKPGVIANDDRGYRFQRYVYQAGNGLAYSNQKTSEDVHRFRPDVWTLTDPYREVALLDMFPGMDLVGTWTYTNNDPKLMLYVETMKALCRGTKQIPLQTVTLLNYPGTLAPASVTGQSVWRGSESTGWMLMGPDRCKEVSWIILSRAPRIIGYYYSSACNPERASRPEDQFRVPRATSEAIREMSERVYKPFGPMITRLVDSRRKIAVLSSQASRLYGRSPPTIGYPNEQIYGFYTAMAMAHLTGDVLFDEHVERGALDGYEVLALPRGDAVTEKMYREILKFVRRGGQVIADSYLKPEIPGAVKFDFDFSYRNKVNADAIAKGVTFANWDDHLNPRTAELAKARGVTAEEDQKIMESFARQLKTTLAGKVSPEVSVDTPTVLVNVLEKHGVRYLVLVNDKRAYDERTGKYRAIMEELVPQTATVNLSGWSGPLFVYDLLDHKPLSASPMGDGYSFQVDLTVLGGKILALDPVRPSKLDISAPQALKRGRPGVLRVAVQDERAVGVPGLQPLRVTVRDPKGAATEYSGYYCAENGSLELPLTPAMNDETGRWKIAAEDLTTGMNVEGTFVVE